MSMLLRRAMMMASSLVKHIISSVTGLVTFTTNVAADMPSVLCEFAPVQSGSGDPSPSNVRPISGWTGLTVTRAGKNCLDPTTVTAGYMNASGVIQAQNATRLEYTSDFIEIPPGVTYVTAGCDGLLSGEQGWVGYCLYNASGTFIQRLATTLTGWSYVIKISDYPQAKYLKVSARTWGHGVNGLCCIFEQNATYAPYEGKTSVTVSWQSDAGTVYGGTLDVATGVLTVTMAYVDLGALSWQAYRTFFYATVADKKSGGPGGSKDNVICDQYPTITYNQCYNGGATGIAGYTYNRRLSIIDPAFNGKTGAEVKPLLSGIYAAYEIDPYQTYQLTPTQIQSIIGTNNVWHNAKGGITVEYYDNQ